MSKEGNEEKSDMPFLNGIRVSMFANAMALKPVHVNLSDVLAQIKDGKYAEKLSELRRMRAVDKKRYGQEKTRLPAFTMSGIATNRKVLARHSNLIQVDLDEVGDALPELCDRLKTDPHVALGFVSPSGEGLKLGVLIDGSRHGESYCAAEAYFKKTYDIDLDPACKDLLRLCFVSYDPRLWMNNKAAPLPIEPDSPKLESKKKDSSKSYVLNDCIPTSLNNYIPTSLNDCIPASLHNKAGSVLENIKARRETLDLLAAKHPNHPNFVNLYTGFIEPRFRAQAHARNGFIVEAVPFLYRCVAPRFVLELVGCFYDCNRTLFNDPREQHMKEANAMLESVAKTYSESLNADERGIYDALPGHEPEAFRICRDLALLPEPKRESLTFFLSFSQLADRLGIYPMQAQRIMQQLESYGLIKLVKKGTRRAEGVRGEAGIYKWLLPSTLQKNLNN